MIRRTVTVLCDTPLVTVALCEVVLGAALRESLRKHLGDTWIDDVYMFAELIEL